MPRTLKFARPDYLPLEPVNQLTMSTMVSHAFQKIQINYCTDMWTIRIPAGSPHTSFDPD
ncbi:hypothetical protein ASPTUDRAFT_40176 [Aspergillus tubingensis CBS 134.48]|uniref:Uncharacterized protein n=1 Tax=Aspergillus tubingensis (strain CBS 134.48) TaxID=767770 RepID=A0A1L9NCV3_ASPTC|nr:hypothetical protein ASPTUDRAFT_40176 [Aspergillus tubingensis CBS 134.48]